MERKALARLIDLRLHLNLVDAFHLVLNRVLDRQDLEIRIVQLVQRRVQGGCFP